MTSDSRDNIASALSERAEAWTRKESGAASAEMEPPKSSAASAICFDVFVAVPSLRSSARASAIPASSAGRAAEPPGTDRVALTSGERRSVTRTTRRPLASFHSARAGILTARIGPTIGALDISMVCAARAADAKQKETRSRAFILRLPP